MGRFNMGTLLCCWCLRACKLGECSRDLLSIPTRLSHTFRAVAQVQLWVAIDGDVAGDLAM